MRGGILCYFLFLALFCFLFLFENFKTTLPTYTNIHSHTYTPTFFFSFLLVNNQSIDPSNPDYFILPHNTTCGVEMLESINPFDFFGHLFFILICRYLLFLDFSINSPSILSSHARNYARNGELSMGRPAKPFFRKQTKSWYCSIDGRQISLGANKRAAFEKFHELMADREKLVGEFTTLYELSQIYLDWCEKNRNTFVKQGFVEAQPELNALHAVALPKSKNKALEAVFAETRTESAQRAWRIIETTMAPQPIELYTSIKGLLGMFQSLWNSIAKNFGWPMIIPKVLEEIAKACGFTSREISELTDDESLVFF